MNQHSNDQTAQKRHSLNSSLVTDWAVPPTSELSPKSLASSSPDLIHNHSPSHDSLAEFDSTIDLKRSSKHRYHSLSSSCPILSSFTTPSQTNETVLKPIKSESLIDISSSPIMKFMLVHNKRSLTLSPITKLLPSIRIQKRRHDNENLAANQQNGQIFTSKVKYMKIEHNDQLIIKDLLNEILE